jgi:hypothetical protein
MCVERGCGATRARHLDGTEYTVGIARFREHSDHLLEEGVDMHLLLVSAVGKTLPQPSPGGGLTLAARVRVPGA